MISLFIILCLFIRNSRSKHSRKATAQASLTANNCLVSILTVCSVCAIVDFLVLELFNSNNLLSEAVVGLRLFYPKSFRKTIFFAFLKARNFK